MRADRFTECNLMSEISIEGQYFWLYVVLDNN